MKDVLEADPDHNQALPLDPFGAKPQWASKIAGLGGDAPSPDPSYIFLTMDSRPAIGTVTAQVHFHDLAASCGTLLIEIRVRSAFPGSEQSRLDTFTVDLQDLARTGGIFEFKFESYRNAYYAIAGSINDETDVSASFISVTLDRRATPEQHGKHWGWRAGTGMSAIRQSDIESALIDRSMTDLKEARLDDPMSQVGSPEQCREPSFTHAMHALRRDPKPTLESWSQAYVLQAIKRFSSSMEGAKMLGYVADEAPLLSYFAAQEHEIVGMRHVTVEEGEKPDPGRELQRLWRPDLCDETNFFAHAHFLAGDIRFPLKTSITSSILSGRSAPTESCLPRISSISFWPA